MKLDKKLIKELANKRCESIEEMKEWLIELDIEDVECLVPDLSGIARGKVIPREKFISSLNNDMLFIPYDIFTQLVTGHFADQVSNKKLYHDLRMIPDPHTIRLSPWIDDGLVAQVICDVETLDKKPVFLSPREVLRNVLRKYKAKKLIPIVSPEIEFYLVKKNLDSDYPLEPAIGVSGRNESGSQAYGIEALNEYDPFIDLLYDYCDLSRIDIDTVLHEGGSAQLEVNFVHSDPLSLADQVFLFKRTARQAAKKQGIYLTFMAKPHSNQPGSSMHLHQSLYDENKVNLFNDDGMKNQFSQNFYHYIGGLQKYLPETSLINFPNINSFKRIQHSSDAPINTFWGIDNRSVGLRVPKSTAHSRRVENRLPGSDVNPYLTMALSLICGLAGLNEKLVALEPVEGFGNEGEDARTIPYHPYEAMQRLQSSKFLKKQFGIEFVDTFIKVKQEEVALYSNLVTAWEREHLLLTV